MKPPYSIPSMSDIAKVRGTNGYGVVSTFSGCGGSCLGFEMDGYSILSASEFVEAARDTYAANHPGVPIIPDDIREISGRDILDLIGRERGDVDVLEGSPPCASFSTSGRRQSHWGKVKQYSDRAQRADDLFYEYARILGDIQPRVFVAENVTGLVRGTAKGYFKEILTALRAQGYEVTAKVLDASWLGVPQARKRLIFVGVRSDLVERFGIHPAHPEPLDYQYTVGEILPSIEYVKWSGHKHNYIRASRPSPTITASDGASSPQAFLSGGGFVVTRDEITEDPETGKVISLGDYAIGAAWDRTLPGKVDIKYLNLIKAHPDAPSPVITALGGQIGAAAVVHPTQRRKYTLAEVRLLSSFPADFVLTGTYEQRWERIGRSVPPLLARAVAQTVRTEILDRIPDGE